MGCDETLMSCANQDDQMLACWDDQEYETSNNAQCIDDKSLRNENLQSMSNTMRCNDTNVSRTCKDGFYPLYKRNLLNSAIGNFVGRTYKCNYNLPGEVYRVKFKIEYKPSSNVLFVKLPVKFMGPGDVDEIIERDSQLKSRTNPGMSVDSGVSGNETMVADVDDEFINTYKNSVERVWSGKYKLYLKEIYTSLNYNSGSCYDWNNISPVDVNVSIEEEDADTSYKVFYLPWACYNDGRCTDSYRNKTWIDMVAFSTKTYNDAKKMLESDENTDDQNVFAHEFGHQIGLGDEYAVDRTAKKGDETYTHVYWDSDLQGHKLKAYERTEYVRQYTLPKEKDLFNHEGVDYFAKEIKVQGKKKKGFVLLTVKNGTVVEVTQKLPGLKSPDPVAAVDTDGNSYDAVYFYDKLRAIERPGPREYDLEKFSDPQKGGKIYHNYKEYSVIKDDTDGKVFYYLKDGSGKIKKEALDGTYSKQFEIVKENFGEEYALENATMFNYDDVVSEKIEWSGFEFFMNKYYIMNEGNNVEPHHYTPFKKGMIEAIRSKYRSHYSPQAPNMEEDWEIK